MLYDDRYFYVAAELEEPHVWGTLTERDSVIFQDNDFEVFIDRYGDNHRYYEFEMNALNTGWDLLLTKPYKDGGVAINGWDVAGLKSAVHVRGTLNDPGDVDQGWSLEIAFPWRALKEANTDVNLAPREGEQWRVNFSRVQWQVDVVDGRYRKVAGRKEDNWVWSPQYVIDMHRPETWGYVQFTRSPPGQARFKPDGTGPARHWLHQVYYAQRDYRQRTGGFAKRLDDLGLRRLEVMGVQMEAATWGYQATMPFEENQRPAGLVSIREDSQVRVVRE
jgi:hypothetical protein